MPAPQIRMHIHATPKCARRHPRSCRGQPEIGCWPLKNELKGYCVCTHWTTAARAKFKKATARKPAKKAVRRKPARRTRRTTRRHR